MDLLLKCLFRTNFKFYADAAPPLQPFMGLDNPKPHRTCMEMDTYGHM